MRMAMASQVMTFWSMVFLHLIVVSPILANSPLAPAMYVFGDSLVDNGNNNYLPTFAKANFLPYGDAFPKGSTGRFTNGKTVADFIADYLGLPYPPPYMSLNGQKSLIGVNYASGSCGILPESGARLGKCLDLKEQINLFEMTVKMNLVIEIENPTQISNHLSKSIFIFSTGSNDYINNYLDKEHFNTSKLYQPKTFAEILVENLSLHIERVYNLGARKIIMFEIGPVGCIPSVLRNLTHKGDCIEEVNQMVTYFNERLPPLVKNLTSRLPGSNIVLGRDHSLGYDVIKNPSKYGLTEARHPCCTTWANETSGCIPLSKPCPHPTKHVFWDAFHLTETVYSIIASGCLKNGSICTPVSIPELVKM
ncbi:hypothetical protein Fmac_016583 [Flemingia macrophylla]|uniref:GDSL esterase/lipase 7 n=1 Tax=Flemingia macrophylla TaxID=520843 RepID=A0ABD1MHR6_9FABA